MTIIWIAAAAFGLILAGLFIIGLLSRHRETAIGSLVAIAAVGALITMMDTKKTNAPVKGGARIIAINGVPVR